MPSPGLAKAASVEALKRAEQRALELAAEQAALRQIATLVARQSSFDQLLSVVAEQAARVFDVPLVSLERYEQDGTVVILGGFSERPPTAPHALGLPIGSRWPREGPGSDRTDLSDRSPCARGGLCASRWRARCRHPAFRPSFYGRESDPGRRAPVGSDGDWVDATRRLS